jgi:hypothetical protein
VFALAPTARSLSQLRAEFPDRVVLRAVRVGDSVSLTP